ncbi:hypothetical protein QIW49_07670 [Francisellaceae bacterium CB300]
MSNSTIISSVALIISIIALIYTVKTYLLKSGTKIRGSYGMCSDRACKDKYISRITLENLKDRSAVIFKIYLQVGHNYFLEVEDFGDKPLILKPFEAFNKEYGPIDLYSVNMAKIDLNKIFINKKVKKKIVLSTSKGKYIINKYIKAWDPLIDFFKNNYTTIISIGRTMHKGKSYGSNVKYILDIKTKNKDKVVAIYPEDYKWIKFNDSPLTEECLASKETLEAYLNELKKSGVINFDEITINDMSINYNEKYKIQNLQKLIEAQPYGYCKYKILGWLLTKQQNRLVRRKNMEVKKRAKE